MHIQELRTAFLFKLRLFLGAVQTIGTTSKGNRKLIPIDKGEFVGPKMKGCVLPGGSDSVLLRSDNVLELDVRLTLCTEDNALIYMTYKGIRQGPEEVLKRLNQGELVDPADYYFRLFVNFETPSDHYLWMNHLFFVGVGQRFVDGPEYDIYQIL